MLIGIAGDSGSGKTTYSNGIRRLLGTDLVQTITMDGYHKENRTQREQSGILPLDPSANHLSLLKEHLQTIKQGKPVQIPIYNHKSGDFETPILFTPSPIVIIEGLHALYSELLPFLDFTIYVDPSRDVKWDWKYERDVRYRGHEVKQLTDEMHKREDAYKRFIDFQKTDADIVIKIFKSKMHEFARYEPLKPFVSNYKVELIMKPASSPLPTITLPFDLANMVGIHQEPFLLAAVPSFYWGKMATAVHLDGILAKQTVEALEKYLVSLTNVPVESAMGMTQTNPQEALTAVQFAQLLIVWRFLEAVSQKLK
jgi:phosphoribulokinase